MKVTPVDLVGRTWLTTNPRSKVRIRFEEVAHAYSTQGKGRLGGVREWLLSFRPS